MNSPFFGSLLWLVSIDILLRGIEPWLQMEPDALRTKDKVRTEDQIRPKTKDRFGRKARYAPKRRATILRGCCPVNLQNVAVVKPGCKGKSMKALALECFKGTVGEIVRREKALDFSGCNSRPGTGSLHPVAIETAAEATKLPELSM
jgi:hypothetical protein